MLVVDVRAPGDALPAAVAEARTVLLRLPASVGEAEWGRAVGAWERREQAARSDPRRRLADLWAGRPAAARPNLASWKAYLAATMREVALLVVEARPQ
jgi:hypothetical protein